MSMKDLILSIMLEQLEEKTNPYAIGMAAAMKATGDEPPLEKSTIKKAHKIAKGIEKNEEVELDEISKKTLGSYIKKASTDSMGRAVTAASGAQTPEAKKSIRKLGYRMQGISRASDKLTKEEAELDEQAMTFQNAENLKNKHLVAMDHHKKSGNSKGYAAHSMVVRKFEDAYDRHGTGVIPAGRILAASQKAFKDHPHSGMKESVELDEVSASTLSSYVDKARADKSRQKKARTVAKNDYKKYGIPSDKERADAAHRKASQRNTGISMAKRKLGGYTKNTQPKVLAREEAELDAVYLEAAQYLLDENIEVDDLTEEQLDELIGSVLKGAAKLAYKGAKTAVMNNKGNFRFSTAGRADAAQAQVQKLRKQQADRKRLEKAKSNIQKLRQARY